ncbi:universal stress protein [Candidatus Methylacidithermus pantelleriae]|uniref:Universal stress protein n=1 Tax=Candidatus Methylacidithermus pantelleriae TaxID=2744239 RepID=A0A8J2BW00_9BACT|nr:universal stress protein [Candidatus Methylacidithermus pantelleriae]CAF0705040.1 Universal stress protein [Candidatus Methylacidithermus pantelleriae]
MYRKILVALDRTNADQVLLPHVSELARTLMAELLLVRVSHGWAARHKEWLNLAESREMREDREYVEKLARELRDKGHLRVGTRLAWGEPAEEILRIAEEEGCDLIAMTSHGHRYLADALLGTPIEEVRHRTRVPMLIVSAIGKREPPASGSLTREKKLDG